MLCAVAFAALTAAPASAFIYWSSGSTTTFRAPNDGSSFGTFLPSAPFSDAVAIDGSHFYWTSRDGRIGRANLNGSAPNPDFITGLPHTSGLPGLAVNGSNIYWSNYSTIGRANLDGTGANPNFITAIHPVGLALNGTYLYWGENETGHIARATLDGKGIDENFVAAPGDPCSVAVDASHLYWADATGNKIGRANLSGSGADPNFLSPGAQVSCGVAVFGSYLYFGLSPIGAASIGHANVDGSNLQANFIGLSPYGAPFTEMAVDSLNSLPVPPVNSFKVFKLSRNPKLGIASIRVKLPGPGRVVLSGRQLKKQVRTISEALTITMRVLPKHKLANKLKNAGEAVTVAKLQFTPTGGSPNTRTIRLKLVRRP